MSNQAKQNNNTPIFVVGTPRSGTTLTARILGRHSQIFMPGETHFFGDIYSRRKELGDLRDPSSMEKILDRLSTLYERYNEPSDQKRIEYLLFNEPEMLKKLRSACKDYKDILSFFMEVQLVEQGKVRWGNNAPKDIFDIENILSFYPNAKILICVRELRDFLLSYKDRWKFVPSEHSERVKCIYHPVITSLLWKSTVRLIPIIKKRVPKENLMIVKYEDLVQNPMDIIYKICKVVGEKFEPEMLEIDSNNSSREVQEKGIFSSSIGRWRGLLTREEAAVAQMIARKELEHLGYKLEKKIEANPFKVFSSFATSPFALYKGLDAGKALRAPLVPYLYRRIISFLSR